MGMRHDLGTPIFGTNQVIYTDNEGRLTTRSSITLISFIITIIIYCGILQYTVSTTVKIKEKTRTKLENLKLHSKETYNDVIERLMITQDDELDPQTIKNIRKSLDDIEKGKIYTLAQVEKELGL